MSRDRRTTKPDVLDGFDANGPYYGGLVGANPGYHTHLQLSANRMRLPGTGAGLRLLDAGCGTGASTDALLACAPDAEIVGVDVSDGMLAQARVKRWPPSVRFVHSPIDSITETDVDGGFDGIF